MDPRPHPRWPLRAAAAAARACAGGYGSAPVGKQPRRGRWVPPHLPTVLQRASRSRLGTSGSDWSGPLVKYFKYHSLQLDQSERPESRLPAETPPPSSPCLLVSLARVGQFRTPRECLSQQNFFFLCARREALFSFPWGPWCSRLQGNFPLCLFL